jgi:hypothetical protein
MRWLAYDVHWVFVEAAKHWPRLSDFRLMDVFDIFQVFVSSQRSLIVFRTSLGFYLVIMMHAISYICTVEIIIYTF